MTSSSKMANSKPISLLLDDSEGVIRANQNKVGACSSHACLGIIIVAVILGAAFVIGLGGCVAFKYRKRREAKNASKDDIELQSSSTGRTDRSEFELAHWPNPEEKKAMRAKRSVSEKKTADEASLGRFERIQESSFSRQREEGESISQAIRMRSVEDEGKNALNLALPIRDSYMSGFVETEAGKHNAQPQEPLRERRSRPSLASLPKIKTSDFEGSMSNSTVGELPESTASRRYGLPCEADNEDPASPTPAACPRRNVTDLGSSPLNSDRVTRFEDFEADRCNVPQRSSSLSGSEFQGTLEALQTIDSSDRKISAGKVSHGQPAIVHNDPKTSMEPEQGEIGSVSPLNSPSSYYGLDHSVSSPQAQSPRTHRMDKDKQGADESFNSVLINELQRQVPYDQLGKPL